MKIKVDECVDYRVAACLRQIGYDADSVFDEGLCGSDDRTVLAAANAEKRLVLTYDQDFLDLVREAPYPPHHGIFRIRLRPENHAGVAAFVTTWFVNPKVVETWANRIVIATETKIRVR